VDRQVVGGLVQVTPENAWRIGGQKLISYHFIFSIAYHCVA
jgi:hypothetical protein